MMRMRTKTTEVTSRAAAAAVKDCSPGENVLEVRPGGMLVQKRDPDEELTRIPPPTIRVRVKYGSIYHEIIISATATFGELKKKLSGPTGLHHEDQKIMYKDKERASKTFLDVVGVKDKSKMVVMEDPISKERRYIEARKNAKIDKANKSISDISLEVDRLVSQVKALDSVIAKGGNVGEKLITNLIELLMNQLLKLDEVKIEGDVNLLKRKQVERVQRYVETLDVLKLQNTTKNHVPRQPRPDRHDGNATTNHNHQSRRSDVGKVSTMATPQQEEVSLSRKPSEGVVVTTQWETFDSLPTIFSDPPSTSTSKSKSTTSDSIQPDFNWDLLLK